MKPEDQVRPQSIQSVGAPKETVRDQDKIMLVLSYLGIFALIPLLTVKDSEYVKWHAKQGLVLTVGGGILAMVLSWIPVIRYAGCLLNVGILVLLVMGIIKALNGERWRIPLVADLADKF
jgi:fumarate reductase subunit D